MKRHMYKIYLTKQGKEVLMKNKIDANKLDKIVEFVTKQEFNK